MTDLERLNEVLKTAFLKIGIYKKADMAEYLGYASPHFSSVINGKLKMSENFMNLISDKLNINPEWVLTGEGEPFLSGKVVQNNQKGDNINGHSVTVNKTETDSFIELLKKKDEQIDRLLATIERKDEQINRLIEVFESKNNK